MHGGLSFRKAPTGRHPRGVFAQNRIINTCEGQSGNKLASRTGSFHRIVRLPTGLEGTGSLSIFRTPAIGSQRAVRSCYHTDAGYIESKVGRLFDTLRINEKSGVPVWVQIRNHMVSLIKMEQIKSGDILPTVRELAAQLGVNYNTIHKVYQNLEADGLICSSRGKRSFVADVNSNALQLPESPVDLVIDQLVKVAEDAGVTKQDVLMRVDERFSKHVAD